MIINVRGTSGSGKTHTVRSFMEHYGPDSTIINPEGKVAAHCVYYHMIPVYLIGSYKNVCGGCDSVPSQDLVCSYVRHFSQYGHVIFEGLIMSHLYARYAALYREMTTTYITPFTFAFMDTPLDVCLARVQQRRNDKGNTKEFNPQNTIGKYESTIKVAEKFTADGFSVVHINHTKDPVRQLTKLLDTDDSYDPDMKYTFREESFR